MSVYALNSPGGNWVGSELMEVAQLLREGQGTRGLDRQNDPDDIAKKISRVRRHPPLRLVHARLRRRPHPKADVGLLPRAEATDWQVVDLGLEFVSLSEAEVASGRPSLEKTIMSMKGIHWIL